MDLHTTVFVLLGLCLAVLVTDWVIGAARRRGERAPAFNPEWLGYLRNNVSVYPRLPAELKKQLQERVATFIEEIDFEPCGGLSEVTDEMRVTIAGYACLLTLEKDTPFYARLRSVLVYPDDYWASDEEGEFEDEVRSGESWGTGSVVLSWDAVRRAVIDPTPGTNVAIHEFAHQIDQATGAADGVPPIERTGAIRTWAKVMSAHFKNLQEKLASGEQTEIDDYAAEHPAEFFAVVTEAFFESPAKLRRDSPELYEQLRLFYRLDPVKWGDAGQPAAAAGRPGGAPTGRAAGGAHRARRHLT
jgi:Mlc titration factor MtfA (ptsG expression regulator)